ncbi:unnamed protein product [Gadus morhua 'NCC']
MSTAPRPLRRLAAGQTGLGKHARGGAACVCLGGAPLLYVPACKPLLVPPAHDRVQDVTKNQDTAAATSQYSTNFKLSMLWTDPRHGLGRAPTAGLGALLLVWGPAACLGPGPAARQGPCCRSGALLLVLDGARLLQSFRADEYQGTREVRSCPAPESEKTQKPRYTSPKDIETHQSSSSVLF